MSSISQTFVALIGLQIAAVISPGPSTILVLQSALRDRKYGMIVALGLWPAGAFWAVFGLFGLNAILTAVPQVTSIMYFVCGLYLIWLGVNALRQSFNNQNLHLHKTTAQVPAWTLFRRGVITNITNPKTAVYYMSIFAATKASALPFTDQLIAVVMMPCIAFTWHNCLTFLVSSKFVKRLFEKQYHWLERITGVVMLSFGVRFLVLLI